MYRTAKVSIQLIYHDTIQSTAKDMMQPISFPYVYTLLNVIKGLLVFFFIIDYYK